MGRRMVSLLEAIKANPKRLAVRSGTKTLFVSVDDIEWIQAAENYVELHLGTCCHLLQATMNTLEASLNPEMFLRIHRSLIVNIGRIKELQPAGHGEYVIVLRSGAKLQSSRSYHEKLENLSPPIRFDYPTLLDGNHPDPAPRSLREEVDISLVRLQYYSSAVLSSTSSLYATSIIFSEITSAAPFVIHLAVSASWILAPVRRSAPNSQWD